MTIETENNVNAPVPTIAGCDELSKAADSSAADVATNAGTAAEADAALDADVATDAPAATDAATELAARLRVERALTANHANTLPMLEILRACDADEARPYREIEDEVYDLPVMQLSHQNAHTLSLLLVDCGALEQTFVEEDPSGECVAAAAVADDAVAPSAGVGAAEPADPADPADPAADPEPSRLEDQPVDYLLGITPAGRAALDIFEPTKRYQRMMAGEPVSYREVYRTVISLCEQGMRMDDIEARLAGMPAMRTPKLVYAGHFVSNLETVDGIAWDDAARLWKTTPHGLKMATL